MSISRWVVANWLLLYSTFQIIPGVTETEEGKEKELISRFAELALLDIEVVLLPVTFTVHSVYVIWLSK